MGDIIRLTTLPHEQQIVYKIPVGGFKFSVKGRENAVIGILPNPDSKSIAFWVVIGQRQRESWIKSCSSSSKVVPTPQILSEEEFRGFWISWSRLSISLGREGEEEPVLSCLTRLPSHLNYATFFVGLGTWSHLEWRIELAPEIPRPVERHVDGGKVEWVRSEQVPWNAVIGGFENETLYVIRSHVRGSLAVGKFVPSKGMGYIAFGSAAHQINADELEFLVGYDCQWVQTTGSQIPVHAIIGGYTEHHPRENIYVGRAWYQGQHLIPGKVHKKYELCYTPYEGREIENKDYEILIAKEINERSNNRLFIESLTKTAVRVSSDVDSDVDENEFILEDFL